MSSNSVVQADSADGSGHPAAAEDLSPAGNAPSDAPDGRAFVVFSLSLAFPLLAVFWITGHSPVGEVLSRQTKDQAVPINSADWTTFSQLPGIGPKTAFLIVADRDLNGPFSSIEDLARVDGIGPMTLDRIRSRLTIGHDFTQRHIPNADRQRGSR